MDKTRKKDLIRTFKEHKPPKGVYRVRCTTTGQVWVDASPTLDKIQNRHWFTLRNGLHHNKQLQEAWNAAGADAFVFEVLEEFGEDTPPLEIDQLLRLRKAHWKAALGAESCD